MPPSIPNSSASAFKLADGSLEDTVNFWKGNLAFVVDMNSSKTDLAATAVTQAATEYAIAPSQTQAPPVSAQAVNDWIRSGGGIVLVVLAVVIATTILLVTRRRRPAAFLSGGPLISPDGAYWWDGRAWRPTQPPRP